MSVKQNNVHQHVQTTQYRQEYMKRIRLVIISTFLTLSASSASASPCKLEILPINPISPERSDIFVGKSNLIELQFKNEKSSGTVEVFPESPLIVKQLKSNTSCAIEGGIWIRKFVFISADNHILITQEYTGSNDSLNFYDTQTCKKMKEIDVSQSSVNINHSSISITKKTGIKGHRKPTTYKLDASCIPHESSHDDNKHGSSATK